MQERRRRNERRNGAAGPGGGSYEREGIGWKEGGKVTNCYTSGIVYWLSVDPWGGAWGSGVRGVGDSYRELVDAVSTFRNYPASSGKSSPAVEGVWRERWRWGAPRDAPLLLSDGFCLAYVKLGSFGKLAWRWVGRARSEGGPSLARGIRLAGCVPDKSLGDPLTCVRGSVGSLGGQGPSLAFGVRLEYGKGAEAAG